MKFLVFPPVDDERLAQIVSAAGAMSVVNARDDAAALAQIVDADAFFGKITPALLARESAALGAVAHGEPRALPVR